MAIGEVKKYNSNYWVGFILLGYCFSWISPLLNSLIFKNNFIEPFLVLGIYFLSKSNSSLSSVINSVFFSKKFLLIVLIVAAFFILGCISNTNEIDSGIGNAYADFRSNIMFVFIQFCFFSNSWKKYEKELFIVQMLSMISIADVITLFIRPYLGPTVTKETISIIAPAILSVYFLRKDKFFACFFFIGLMCYEAIVGFYRNYYIVVIVVFMICVYILATNYTKGVVKRNVRLKSLVFVILIIFAIVFSYKKVYNYWTSDDSRMVHSINRTTDFLDNASTENVRINSTLVPIEDFDLLLVPNGLGWRNYVDEISKNFSEFGIISTMDSCFFYLAFHYSVFVALCVLYIYLKRIIGAFTISKDSGLILNRFIRLCFLLLFCSSFFTQGLMFAFIQGAFVYSLLLALIISPI